MNTERYSPEQAQEEAARMKAKMESGEVSSYDEAEKLVEQDSAPLSVGGLKQSVAELKAKVEAAKLQKEKDVEQKISERESLIAEVKNNRELLGTARESLEYFTSMQELDQLDETDVQKLEELRALVSSLENQRVEIEKKIAVISSRPEVLEKLQDAAKKEDTERSVKNLVEKAHAELEPQIDQIAASIKDLANRKNLFWKAQKKQESEVSGAWKKIDDAVSRAKDMLSDKSNFGYTLEQIFIRSKTPQELSQKLIDARKELGMFKGKEKAAIDFVLGQTQVFEEYNRASEQLASLEGEKESIAGVQTSLAEQWSGVLLKSWDVQSRINELLGRHPDAIGLSRDLQKLLQEHIGKFMAESRRFPDANSKSEGNVMYYLYYTLEKVEEMAGGLNIIMRDPRRNKKQE